MNYAKVIILAFAIVGSIFVNSSLLTDSQILPKWFCFVIGVTLLSFVMGFQLLQKSTSVFVINKTIIARIISLSVVLQAFYALARYNYWWNQDVVFNIGSFENPAGFASCLCVGMPYVALFFRVKSRWMQISAFFFILVVLSAIYVSKSRAGYVSCVVMFVIFLLLNYNTLSRRLRLALCIDCFSAIVGIVIAFCSMSNSKHDSMNGRKLIWTVGMEMVKDKPLLGHGLGSIEKCYMNYQADYLKCSASPHEMMLADNVKHVFNDYLAIAVQFGIVGVLCVMVYVALLFYSFFKIAYKDRYAQIGILSLLGLGSFALFSYPSCYPLTWMMIAIDSWFVFSPCLSGDIRLSIKMRKLLGLSIILLAMVAIFQIGKRLKAELTWKKLYDMRLAVGNQESLNGYQEIYPQLCHEPYFLYNYAVELSVDKQYSKSLQIAEECSQYWADYDLNMVKAYNFKELGRYSEAIKCFLEAEAMCPKRFEPIYDVMRIYWGLHQISNAEKYAKQIIDKPVKVYSTDVTNMKDEAKKILIDNSK